MTWSILITHLDFNLVSLKSHFLLYVMLFYTDFSCLLTFIFYGRSGCEHNSQPCSGTHNPKCFVYYFFFFLTSLLLTGETFSLDCRDLGYCLWVKDPQLLKEPFSLEYIKVNLPSGMTGIGGVTIVHPAFLKRSICKIKKKQPPPRGLNLYILFLSFLVSVSPYD